MHYLQSRYIIEKAKHISIIIESELRTGKVVFVACLLACREKCRAIVTEYRQKCHSTIRPEHFWPNNSGKFE